MLKLLAKLRARSAAELRERATQKVSALLEAHGLLHIGREPTDRELGALVAADALEGGWSPEAWLDHFRRREQPPFFAGVRDHASAVALRGARWTDALAALRASADRIVAGEFDLLGHAGLTFGSPIDWHLDPTTGRRSPRAHWSRIPYLDVEVVGDHKVVWEINRHQHFVVLGRAYQATNDATYATAFAHQIESWMDENPPKLGVNWASSLEIGYRAISWLWALELFRNAPQLSAATLTRATKHLYLHGRHLERYLSTYFSPNTHLTGEALGLLYLGICLPELRRAEEWRARGWEILERELMRQVYPDGVYFEQATYYHRYTVDIYLHALLLARLAGRQVSPVMTERLSLALTHLADLTRPDGTIPLIGDDDGGRLIALEDRLPQDVRSALSVGAVALGRPDLARVAGGATEETLWLLGPGGARQADDQASAPPPAHLSRLYPEGGFAIMRDGWGPLANHAVIDCGPHGTMNCGHAHADALSIELSAFGRPVLVDPGTFTYTGLASDRDHFRHSATHNTLTIDGGASSVPNGPFSWESRADARIDSWWSGDVTDCLVGSHPGFRRLPDPVDHRRRVLFVRGAYWVVVDGIDAREQHEATAHYHLAAGAVARSTGACAASITVPGATGDRRIHLAAAGDVTAVEWSEDWVSPAYGVRTMAPVGRVIARGRGRRILVTVLIPHLEGAAVSVDEHPCEGGCAVTVTAPGIRDVLLLRRDGVVRAQGMELDGDAALVRGELGGSTAALVALFGEDARLRAGRLELTARGAAELTRAAGGWSVRGTGAVVDRAADGD